MRNVKYGYEYLVPGKVEYGYGYPVPGNVEWKNVARPCPCHQELKESGRSTRSSVDVAKDR